MIIAGQAGIQGSYVCMCMYRQCGVTNFLKLQFSSVFCTQVPFRDGRTEEESLKLFYDEVPVLELLSTSFYVGPNIAFTVDSDVQLVCKYLQAYKRRLSGKYLEIDKLYKEKEPVKFSLYKDLTDEECHQLLQEFIPKQVAEFKTTQQLFVRLYKLLRSLHIIKTTLCQLFKQACMHSFAIYTYAHIDQNPDMHALFDRSPQLLYYMSISY